MPAPPDAPATAVREAYKEAQLALRRLRAREGRGGLTLARLAVLRELAARGELRASGLAAAAELSPPTLTRMLADLEGCGLVERVRDDADRRVVRVRLTDAGREQHAAFEARVDGAWADALADVPADDLAAGVRVLLRIRAVLDGL